MRPPGRADQGGAVLGQAAGETQAERLHARLGAVQRECVRVRRARDEDHRRAARAGRRADGGQRCRAQLVLVDAAHLLADRRRHAAQSADAGDGAEQSRGGRQEHRAEPRDRHSVGVPHQHAAVHVVHAGPGTVGFARTHVSVFILQKFGKPSIWNAGVGSFSFLSSAIFSLHCVAAIDHVVARFVMASPQMHRPAVAS